MHFAQAAHAVRREELVRIDHARQQVLQLVLIDHREDVRDAAVVAHRLHALLDDVAAVLHEPFEVFAEDVERLDPLQFQPLDGVERDETDQRADAERNGVAVGEAQQVIEERVRVVPQRRRAANHLHGRADVDVVLEEFRGQPFVNVVLPGQLQSHAHHDQAEHAHPSGGVALLERGAGREFVAAIENGDVVEAEEAAFENVVAFAVDLVHPPGEIQQ